MGIFIMKNSQTEKVILVFSGGSLNAAERREYPLLSPSFLRV